LADIGLRKLEATLHCMCNTYVTLHFVDRGNRLCLLMKRISSTVEAASYMTTILMEQLL